MFKRAANSVPSWVLSGKAFLQLDSLTIVHSELYPRKFSRSLFPEDFVPQPAAMPSLSRLRILSPFTLDNHDETHPFHPLLVGIQGRYPGLSHLILCDSRVSVASLVRGLYSDDKEMSLNARKLPAPLESVVVQPGDRHEIRNGGRRTENFMRAVNQLRGSRGPPTGTRQVRT